MPTFSPPTYEQGFLDEPGANQAQGLMRYYDFDVGRSVLITGGAATPYPGRTVPSTDDINAADAGSGMGGRAAFIGGRDWTITGSEYQILEDAGYFTGGAYANNILDAATARLETGVGEWTVWGTGTFTQSTDDPFAGTYSGRFTKAGTGYEGIETTTGTGGFPIQASTQYSINMLLRTSVTNEIEFLTYQYRSNGTYISASGEGYYIFPSPSEWTLYQHTWTSKPDAAYIAVAVAFSDGAASSWFEVDNLAVWAS